MANPCLDYLLNPGFQGVNRPFVSSFENSTDSTSTRKILPSNYRNKGL